MTTYTLPENGTYEFDPAYDYPHYALVATGSGIVTVEYRHPGSDVWRMVPEELDASDENIVRFTGIVDQFRFVLTESSGGAVITARTQDVAAFDTNLLSGPVGYQRLRVDGGEPGFWYGRQFGVSYEFSVDIGERQVIKVQTGVDTLLYSARIETDTGDLYYRVFSSPDDSIETAAFNDSLTDTLVPLNTMSFAPSYSPVVLISTGGDIDETGLVPFPISRIRTADNSNFRNTTNGEPGQRRGFGIGFAYIVLEPLNGEAVTGTLEYRLEERDWAY